MAGENQPIDSSLADSIAMLEQILEVMPQDMDALKALYTALRQGGMTGKSFGYLGRMVDVVSGGGAGADDLTFVLQELEGFEVSRPSEVSGYLSRLSALAGSASHAAASSPGGESLLSDAETGDADVGEELALAWQLYEEGQLSQEEYSCVLHDLTEISSKELDVPASVLHVLSDRGFTQINRVINHMSSRSGVPCITLANFELIDRVAEVLPMEFAVHEGALPFAFFGDDLLVAVLNPFNSKLVDKVERVGGCRCRTYLVAPEDYDASLDRLRSLAGHAA
jgi:hypothetical protein